MAHKVTILRNLKTGKDHHVGEDGLKRLKELNMLIRYEVVEERVVKEGAKKTFLPDEIREESSEAQRAADAVLNQNTGGLRGRD